MKPTIAWFAPADSKSLRLHLERQFEVREFGETATGFLDPGTNRSYRVRPGSVSGKLIRELNKLEAPVYNLGSGLDCLHTLFLSRRKPGIVVLGRENFSHLIEAVYRGPEADRQTFVRLMIAYYGVLGREAAVAGWDARIPIEFMREYFPFTRFATENALAVAVVSEEVFASVRAVADVPIFLLSKLSATADEYVAGLREIVDSVPQLRLRRVKADLAARIGRTIPTETAEASGWDAHYAQALVELFG